MNLPQVLTSPRWTAARIFVLFLLLFGLSTKRAVSSWNDASRMATIQALVEQHTLAIDHTAFVKLTSDTYVYQGHTYSSKPPALAVIGALIYAPMYWAGITFGRDPSLPYFVITLLTIGTLSALGIAFFWKILVEIFAVDDAWAKVTTFIAGAGTLVLPYSTVFNSHVIGGALLVIGFYYAFKNILHPHARFALTCGLLLALAGSIETTCLLFIPFALLVLFRRSCKDALVFSVACTPFLIFYLATNLALSGSLLPPTLNAPLRSTVGSAFSSANLAGLTSHQDLSDALVYAFHMLIGNRGLFSHTPILLLAIPGSVLAYRHRRTSPAYTALIWLLAACVLFILLAILRTNNYGGSSYGVRWYATIMLMLCLPIGFLSSEVRSKRWLSWIFWALGAVSVALALIGSYRPFLPSTEPVVGQPGIVDNTIWLAIVRLATLSTPLGLSRFLLVAAVVLAALILLKRDFDRSRATP
jgi:hypothetical membrane protein